MKKVTSSKRKMNHINKEAEKFYIFTTESYTKAEFTELETSDFPIYVWLLPLIPSFLLQICCYEAHNASCTLQFDINRFYKHTHTHDVFKDINCESMQAMGLQRIGHD